MSTDVRDRDHRGGGRRRPPSGSGPGTPSGPTSSPRRRATASACSVLERSDEEELAAVALERELQKRVWGGGFAGIGFPTEYGGLGLSPDYHEAFNRAVEGRHYPSRLNVPSFSIVAPVILDFGTEEQKQFYIRGALKGEIVLSQFLSEPKGGSDLAGVISRADRDGDTWVLNGSKIWSTAAYGADYGIALVRTDWDAPSTAASR